MTKSVMLVALGALLLLVVIGAQRMETRRLKETNRQLQEQVARVAVGRGGERGDSRSGEEGRVGGRSLEEVMALSDPESRIEGLVRYARGLQVSEIPRALEELRRGTPDWDPEAKMLAHILLTRWANADPEGALASLRGIDLKRFGADPVSVLSSVASRDPARALAWLEDPGNAMVRSPWMGQILAGTVAKEWVRQDPAAALAWARGLPDSQRTGALTGVLESLAAIDPRQASRLAMDLADDGARQHVLGEIAEAWAQSSPLAAMEWAEGLAGADRERALTRGLDTWARRAPSEAAAFVESLAAGERGPYLAAVAGPWAGEAPEAAAVWVTAQDDGEGAGKALESVLWNWTVQDPVAAAEWLGEQPTGPARDGGITGLAKAAFEGDPGGALSWAGEISEEGRRSMSVAIGLKAWMGRDAAAATEWAEANGVAVPEGEK